MKNLVSVTGLLTGVIVLCVLAGGCCRWRPGPGPGPTLSTATFDCNHPDIGKVERCIDQCANSASANPATCIMGCCARISYIHGTDAERNAARRCVPQCAPAP